MVNLEARFGCIWRKGLTKLNFLRNLLNSKASGSGLEAFLGPQVGPELMINESVNRIALGRT